MGSMVTRVGPLSSSGTQLLENFYCYNSAHHSPNGHILGGATGGKMRSGQNREEQLDSWKEIAAYFGRDARTVRRWEKARGLPVHRYPGGERGRVYAHTEELERWFKGVDVRLLGEENPTESASEGEPGNLFDSVSSAPDQTVQDNAIPLNVASNATSLPQEAAPIKPERASFAFLRLKQIGFVGIALTVLLAYAFPLHRALSTASRRTANISKPEPVPSASSEAGVQVSKHVPDPQAMELYLKGRFYWNRRSAEDLRRALDYFTQSVVKDPQFAPAYAGLADTYFMMRQYSTMPDHEAYQRGLAAAQRAVQLDDSLSEGHRALAFALFYGYKDPRQGEQEIRRAIELNPNDMEAHHWYSTMLMTLHRYPESIEQIDRARQLAPMSTSIEADRDLILFMAGRETEGIQSLQQLEQTEPGFLSPHRYLASIFFDQGSFNASLNEEAKVASLLGSRPVAETVRNARIALETKGKEAMLQVLVEEYKRDPKASMNSSYSLAEALAAEGHRKEALEMLANTAADREYDLRFAKSDPALQPLHNDPEFIALLDRAAVPLSK
jgi:tetratricopeptide (TPR) repeat protein